MSGMWDWGLSTMAYSWQKMIMTVLVGMANAGPNHLGAQPNSFCIYIYEYIMISIIIIITVIIIIIIIIISIIINIIVKIYVYIFWVLPEQQQFFK